VPHQDMLMVRFLDDRFLDPADLVAPKVMVSTP
jgi:hypothetical protein